MTGYEAVVWLAAIMATAHVLTTWLKGRGR